MYEPRFIYRSGDNTYILVPEVRASPRKTWLLGAGMYSLDGDYVGYWHRGQMPLPLIRDLTAHWKKVSQQNRVGYGPVVVPDRGRKAKR